mmetsp:Transcript_13276/g.49649  ORF Transcript_13276/g.49649 Transcript_13276/m.49649 type:complete len:290 (+) Transcript_13276:1595-2464(+)
MEPATDETRLQRTLQTKTLQTSCCSRRKANPRSVSAGPPRSCGTSCRAPRGNNRNPRRTSSSARDRVSPRRTTASWKTRGRRFAAFPLARSPRTGRLMTPPWASGGARRFSPRVVSTSVMTLTTWTTWTMTLMRPQRKGDRADEPGRFARPAVIATIPPPRCYRKTRFTKESSPHPSPWSRRSSRRSAVRKEGWSPRGACWGRSRCGTRWSARWRAPRSASGARRRFQTAAIPAEDRTARSPRCASCPTRGPRRVTIRVPGPPSRGGGKGPPGWCLEVQGAAGSRRGTL